MILTPKLKDEVYKNIYLNFEGYLFSVTRGFPYGGTGVDTEVLFSDACDK